MRILLDTNILILRENNHVIPENLSQMMNLINGLEKVSIWVHPLSIQEIKKDKNLERQSVNLSKINGYAILETYPDYTQDKEFVSFISTPLTENDFVDNQLLYCATKNVVDYLITEDQGILNKANSLGLEQVLNINEAISCFKKFYPNSEIDLLPTFKRKMGHEINLDDEIFGTLKNEYNFTHWWNTKVSRRELFVYENDNRINAILVPKIEEKENIDCSPSLYRERILKICTFKVAEYSRGLKLGERLLKMAFDLAIANNIDEVYLTHFRQEQDYLIPLIESFGFCKYGVNKDGEEVYLKRIVPLEQPCVNNLEDVTSINQTFYPSFYDGSLVKKHLIPIRPNFHKKLFPDFKEKGAHQIPLLTLEFSEGNSIKKAYICNSGTRLINKGDVLLFYQTHERKAVTTIGTVESVYYGLRDAEQIFKLIAKRTVFNLEEVKECCSSDVTVILFNQNFNLESEVEYNTMEKNNIVNGYIQSITNIDDKKYRKIIKDNINERFIIH